MKIGELNIKIEKNLNREPILYIKREKKGNTVFRVTNGGDEETSPFLRFWREGRIDDCPALVSENIMNSTSYLNRIMVYGGEGAMFGKPSESLGVDNKNIIMKKVRVK